MMKKKKIIQIKIKEKKIKNKNKKNFINLTGNSKKISKKNNHNISRDKSKLTGNKRKRYKNEY